MDEEKPAVTEIPPLRWPEERSKGFASLNPLNLPCVIRKELMREISARPSIPIEVWGPDPKRREMASMVSSLIANGFGWSKDRFLPQDQIKALLLLPVSDGFDAIEVIMQIEEELFGELEIPMDVLPGTLADLVDMCLAANKYWPVNKWTPNPEDDVCPTFSAFYDIRRFICSRYSLDRKIISPSTPLSGYSFNREDWPYMNQYLEKRFGVKDVTNCRYRGLFPIWSSILIHTLIFFVLLVLLFQVSTIGGVLMTAVFSFFLGSNLVAADSWRTWRKGLRTFRDLVEYVVAESTTKTPVIQGK